MKRAANEASISEGRQTANVAMAEPRIESVAV